MDAPSIELQELLKIVKKRRKTIFISFLIFSIAAGIFSFLIPPTYEAETKLRVKQPKGLADSLLADLPLESTNGTQQLMLTYAEILKSRSVIETVIEKTQKNDTIPPKYEEFVKRISAQPVKNTEILSIKVRAKSPEEGQTLANMIVNTFTERMITLVQNQQGMVRQFIGERLQDSKLELEKAENALEQYKRNQKIIAADDQAKAIISKYSNIDQLAAQNAVNLATAHAKIGAAQQELSQEKIGYIADNLLIQQHKSKLADLEVQLVAETQRYTEKHPKIMALKAAINETRANLSTEISKVANSEAVSLNPIHQSLVQAKLMAEADAAAAAAQKAAIQKILNDSEKELSSLPAKEQGLAKLTREMQVNQEIYLMLAKRHEEARISEVMQPSDVQVVDTANKPEEPVFPKKGVSMILGALLGLIVGILWAAYLEYTKRTIDSVEDVKEYLRLPVVGVVPNFDKILNPPQESLITKMKKNVFSR